MLGRLHPWQMQNFECFLIIHIPTIWKVNAALSGGDAEKSFGALHQVKKAFHWMAKVLLWPTDAGDNPPKMYHPSKAANLSTVAQTDEALLLWV